MQSAGHHAGESTPSHRLSLDTLATSVLRHMPLSQHHAFDGNIDNAGPFTHDARHGAQCDAEQTGSAWY
jgi:hypothetical protein